jgi:putative transposase
MNEVGRKHPPHFPPTEQHNTATIIFVTVCTKNKRSILTNDPVHNILLTAWLTHPTWLVGRYVIMPDHDDTLIWQRHFWDTQLRRADNYGEKWDYVVNNPVRAGLVLDARDWPYQGELNVLQW